MSEPLATFAADDVEIRRRRFGSWLTVLATLLVLAGFGFSMSSGNGEPWLSLLGSLSMLAGTALNLGGQFWKRKDRGRLELTKSTLFFAGRPLMHRASIKQAYGFGSDAKGGVGKRSVRVSGAASCDLTFPRDEDAQTFLATVAQSAGDTTATFYAFAGGRKTRWAMVAGALTLMLGMVAVAVALMVRGLAAGGLSVFAFVLVSPLIVLPIFLMRHLALRRLVVGTDGVLVRLPFGRSEFVPLGRIRGATLEGTDVHLSIEGERRPRRLALGGMRRLQGTDVDVNARALIQRIEEARAQAGVGAAGAATLTVLARGSRTVADWIRQLAVLSEGAATFRSSAIPRDQLWRVVDDATVATELRVGAALALRRELGDEDRTRFRLASNVSADPALRKVFLAAGDDDEAELAAAVNAEESSRSRKL